MFVHFVTGPCTDDVLLARICGAENEKISDSTGLYVLLHFHTDGSVTKTGFSVSVYIS